MHQGDGPLRENQVMPVARPRAAVAVVMRAVRIQVARSALHLHT
jgi:hypothetical protein